MGISELYIIIGLSLNIITFIAIFFSSKQKETIIINKTTIGVNRSAVINTTLLIVGFSLQVLGAIQDV